MLQELSYRDGAVATWTSLGYAHRGLHDYAHAAICYQRAIDLCRDRGEEYHEATALVSLGDTHHAAERPDDARMAWQHALDIFDRLHHPGAHEVRDRLHQPAEPATMTCGRHGQHWRIGYGRRTVPVPHSVGMLHLAVLLANPGQDIPALELASGVATLLGSVTDTGQPVLDQRARSDYRQRIGQLRERIDLLEASDQPDRAAGARTERDWLVRELAGSTTINGRTRSFPNNPERARVAVTRAIRRTLTHVTTADTRLGEHLHDAIHTGARCSYRPTP